jgi:hypothetical protein
MPRDNGSAAGAIAPPQSALRASLHHCADRLAYVGQLAGVSCETGRLTQGARYIVDELDDLAGSIAKLRAHVAQAPTPSP